MEGPKYFGKFFKALDNRERVINFVNSPDNNEKYGNEEIREANKKLAYRIVDEMIDEKKLMGFIPPAEIGARDKEDKELIGFLNEIYRRIDPDIRRKNSREPSKDENLNDLVFSEFKNKSTRIGDVAQTYDLEEIDILHIIGEKVKEKEIRSRDVRVHS